MSKKAGRLYLEQWDRQPGESAQRWEAFQTYRDMEATERSLVRVAARLSKSETLMSRWSVQNHWVARVRAYDTFIDQKITQEGRLKDHRARVDMLARHTNVTLTVQNAIVLSFQNMKAEDWAKVSVVQRVEVFHKMAQFERVSRGLPSDTIEVRTPEQIKDQTVTEAMLYLKEMKHDFPVLSEREHLLIVCEEFEVQPEDLGYKPADLEPQEIGSVG